MMLDISAFITQYGPWAIFALVLIEDFGVPVPGETALISAAVLASQGKLSIEWLLPAAWLGAVIGDNIGYGLGRFGGRRLVLRYGRHLGITDTRLNWVERFFTRYGGVTVVAARFFAGLRQLNGIVAGVACMPAPRFVLFNAVGATLWVGFWGFGAYWFGAHFRRIFHTVGPVPIYIGGGAAALLAIGVLVWRYWYGLRRDS